MERRRFLAIGATGALVLVGCARLLDEQGGEAAPDPGTEGRPSSGSGSGSTSGSSPTEAEPSDDASSDATEDADGEVDPGGEVGADGETDPGAEDEADPGTDGEVADELDREVDPSRYDEVASEWGEHVSGVGRRLADSTAIALTFDACGGGAGNGYDAELIEHLRANEIPATLFINTRWLDANPRRFDELAADPLFQIENHGTAHRPLSIDGRSAYGIAGTRSVDEVIDEVMGCQHRLTELTGRAPRFFRSGTAHYDDVAVQIVHDLGLHVAGYSVLGDAGATFSASQVRDQLVSAPQGAVVLLHMNHPRSGTADGVASALPQVLAAGRRFTTLGDRPLI